MTDILHQIFREICIDRVFKLSLDSKVLTDATVVCVTEECK
jgi:hypothetical protein